jgi:sulfatase modifying factor 1
VTLPLAFVLLWLAPKPSGAAAAAPPQDMVRVPGGTYRMGSDQGPDNEKPAHAVTVHAFWMDRYELTNRAFERFVAATHYVTEAEKQGWSGVFDPRQSAWTSAKGADWRHPDGPQSSLDARWDHPVVHVCWDDANAFCGWAGKRLPTEAEWERAARGGREGAEYAWGDTFKPRGRFRANTWQGTFPEKDRGEDGFAGIAPVGRFPPNAYGLYDIIGNVWEWTADWYADDAYAQAAAGAVDPKGAVSGTERVIRGGSWLCSDNYCTGYRVSARQHTPHDSGLNNVGFRCVQPAP